MSGIVGIINRDQFPIDRQLLERLTDALSFRGPDARGVWTAGHVGFGHALLRTTDDGPPETQPFSLDGVVWILADARVDDRPNLIGQLKPVNLAPPGQATDAELLLRAYLAWGDECTAHLLGDFVFAIWDGRTNRLFCVRDQLGGKPFFYATVPSGLVFSNTMECLRRHPGVSDELNEQAMADYLLFGHNTEPETTMFADVRRLPAAHTLEWTGAGTRIRQYWTLPVREPVYYRNPADYVERFGELLQTAVADRLRTNRVSVLMSGGLDSSSVAATAHDVLSKQGRPFDLRASTVVCDRVIPDEERHYAGLVASTLQIPISYEVVDSYKLFEKREYPPVVPPEPRSLASAARQFDRMKKFAEHGSVVLTGQAGDIILRPSPSYLLDTLKRLQFGRFAGDAWEHFRSYGRLPRLGVRTRLKRLRRRRSRLPFPDWIEPGLSARLDLKTRWDKFHAGRTEPVHHHRPEAYRIMTSQWFRLFESLDPGSTGFPIEWRHPLFDLRLVDFALSIPSMPWCAEKALLREVMRGKLPEAVRVRRKTPLGGDPLESLLEDPGAEWLSQVPESPLLRQYVRREAASNLLNLVYSARPDVLHFRPLYLNYWINALRPPEA